MMDDITTGIFAIKDGTDFRKTALDIYNYQADQNPVYKDFIKKLSGPGKEIKSPGDVPFLPIEFFKRHKIISGDLISQQVFESSGTTGSAVSRHFVADLVIYEQSFLQSFRLFYGNLSDYVIAALLPSYTARKSSSLVYMVDSLIKRTNGPISGFYRENVAGMLDNINMAVKSGKKVILIGVSYALLDIAEKYSPDLSGVIVMETGGMKGRREEIIRDELHSILKKSFNVNAIHSEYGMTELLSQAWSKGGGIYFCPPWMKILIRDPQDPLTVTSEPGITGGINVIDLANVHSCSFIATGDMGRLHDNGSFEVLGRIDNSDIRGCNLLIS